MNKRLKMASLVLAFCLAFIWLSVALHNLISGLLGFEEPLFFSLALITIFIILLILFYLLFGLLISLFKGLMGPQKKRKTK
jgi:hypothetical protein